MAFLGLISDLLLLTATLGLAGFAWVLSRRQPAAPDIPEPDHTALAELRAEIEALKAALDTPPDIPAEPSPALQTALDAADDRIGRLEVLLAGLEGIEDDLERRLEAEEQQDETIVLPTFRAARPNPEGNFVR